MPRYKGFLEVAVPGGGRTVRERRTDVTICAHCGRNPRTLYDYFDNEKLVNGRVPAFCNKSCAIGYRLESDHRRLTEVDGEPRTVKAAPVSKLERPIRTKSVRAQPVPKLERPIRTKSAGAKKPVPKRTPRRRKTYLSVVG